jgi:hypothetical protein
MNELFAPVLIISNHSSLVSSSQNPHHWPLLPKPIRLYPMTAVWTSNEGQWHPELRIKPPPRRVNFHSRCHSLQRLSMSNHCSASTIGVSGPHPVCQTARIAPLAADLQGQDARDTIGPGQRTPLHNGLAVPTRCFTLAFPPWLGVTGLELAVALQCYRSRTSTAPLPNGKMYSSSITRSAKQGQFSVLSQFCKW